VFPYYFISFLQRYKFWRKKLSETKLLCPFVSFVVIFISETQKAQKKTKEPQKQKAKEINFILI